MVKHKKCGGLILIVKKIEFECGFNLTDRGLQSAGVPEIRGIDFSGKDLVCKSCGEHPDLLDDVLFECAQCGEGFSAEKLFLHRNSNLLMCKKHLDEFFPGEAATNLSAILKNNRK